MTPDPSLLDDLLAGRTEDPGGVIYGELVRHVVGPDLTDDEVGFILWERTPWPLVNRPDQLLSWLETVRDERRAK